MSNPRLAPQRGLSLSGCAVLMALLAYGAMAAIFALRYQRNLIAESWAMVAHSSSVAAVAEHVRASDAAALRKCKLGGRILYSNHACTDTNPSTQTVDLAQSRGFLAPKTASALPEEGPAARRGASGATDD